MPNRVDMGPRIIFGLVAHPRILSISTNLHKSKMVAKVYIAKKLNMYISICVKEAKTFTGCFKTT